MIPDLQEGIKMNRKSKYGSKYKCSLKIIYLYLFVEKPADCSKFIIEFIPYVKLKYMAGRAVRLEVGKWNDSVVLYLVLEVLYYLKVHHDELRTHILISSNV